MIKMHHHLKELVKMDKVLIILSTIWTKNSQSWVKWKVMKYRSTFQTKNLIVKIIIKATKKVIICSWYKKRTSFFVKTKTTESSFASQLSYTKTNHSAEFNLPILKYQKLFRREIPIKMFKGNRRMTWDTYLALKPKRPSKVK